MPKKKKQFFFKKRGKKNTTDPSSPGAGTSQLEPSPGSDGADGNTMEDEVDPYLELFFPDFTPEIFDFIKTSPKRRKEYRDFRDVVLSYACEGIGMVQLLITSLVVAAAIFVMISGSRDEALAGIMEFWRLPKFLGNFIWYHTDMQNLLFLGLERYGLIVACVVAAFFHGLLYAVLKVQLQRTNEHRQTFERYALYTFCRETFIPINWYIMKPGMLLVLWLPNAMTLFLRHLNKESLFFQVFKAAIKKVTFYSPHVFQYFAMGFVVIYRLVSRSCQYLSGSHYASRLGMGDTVWVIYTVCSFIVDLLLVYIVLQVFDCYPLAIYFCSDLNCIAFNYYYQYSLIFRSVAFCFNVINRGLES